MHRQQLAKASSYVCDHVAPEVQQNSESERDNRKEAQIALEKIILRVAVECRFVIARSAICVHVPPACIDTSLWTRTLTFNARIGKPFMIVNDTTNRTS